MNREIKFRAWDKRKSKMVNFEYLQQHKSGFMLFDKEDWGNEFDLMQFTGLLDRHGVEIYEGDILSVFDIKEPVIDVVTFNDLGWKHGEYYLIDCINWDLEVIGNIYENPALSKEWIKSI